MINEQKFIPENYFPGALHKFLERLKSCIDGQSKAWMPDLANQESRDFTLSDLRPLFSGLFGSTEYAKIKSELDYVMSYLESQNLVKKSEIIGTSRKLTVFYRFQIQNLIKYFNIEPKTIT